MILRSGQVPTRPTNRPGTELAAASVARVFSRRSVWVLWLPLALSAQWPRYQTGPVTDLGAAAPRTVGNKPDFTGIWRNSLPTRSPDAFPAPLRTPSATGIPTGLEQFGDISAGLDDGLPLAPWAADLKRQRVADLSKDNPDAHCLPMGNMQFHTHPQPRKMIQTSDLLVILYEGNAGIRQIFLDGRPLPPSDVEPWWYGYSTGRWEGDTLVVETSGFRDGGWLDINGSPLTDAAKMTERFRRVNYGNLEIEITVDDPKAYTRPWTVTVKQTITPDDELIEFICQENERDAPHLVGN